MEQAAAIIGISGIIILLINIANQKRSHFGSDHYFHLNLIRLIKNNRHRFITRYSNFIGNEYASYPQFFHWVFSFFTITKPARVNFIYKSVIFFLDVSFFLIFFYSGFLQFTSRLPLLIVFLYAALLFIFTPFNFVRWNSGNAGFSPRGLGVLLGRHASPRFDSSWRTNIQCHWSWQAYGRTQTHSICNTTIGNLWKSKSQK